MPSDEENLNESFEKEQVEKSPLHPEPTDCDLGFFGPALPLHLLRKNSLESKERVKIYGPRVPDHLSKKEDELNEATSNEKRKICIGPEVPEFLKSSQPSSKMEEDETFDNNFGPSTTLMATGDVTNYHKCIISRNSNTKNCDETKVKRETWMTELPEKKRANFGLLPRHFKSRIQTDKESDDSVWTETPLNKNREGSDQKKNDHKEILKMMRLEERNKEMEKLVKKAAKKQRKKESLLEMHLKRLKKKKKKESKKQNKESKSLPERRPFDRNIDLQVRKFDENQKRAILHKSHLLNDRFAPGQNKFL